MRPVGVSLLTKALYQLEHQNLTLHFREQAHSHGRSERCLNDYLAALIAAPNFFAASAGSAFGSLMKLVTTSKNAP